MIIDEVYRTLVKGASRAFHQLTALLIVTNSDLASAKDETAKLDLVFLIQIVLCQILVIHTVAWAQKFTSVLHIMHVVVFSKVGAGAV